MPTDRERLEAALRLLLDIGISLMSGDAEDYDFVSDIEDVTGVAARDFGDIKLEEIL